MRFLLIILFVTVAFGSAAWAYPSTDEEYLQEIREEVLYPCWQETMRLYNRETILSARVMHAMVRHFDPNGISIKEKYIFGTVKGRPIKERMKFYVSQRKRCIDTMQAQFVNLLTEN